MKDTDNAEVDTKIVTDKPVFNQAITNCTLSKKNGNLRHRIVKEKTVAELNSLVSTF